MTATELRELEDKFWKDVVDRYNKSVDDFLEPLLNKMLEIAREHLKKDHMDGQ